MVHQGIFLLHFVFEVMLPDYINLSQNWPEGISAEKLQFLRATTVILQVSGGRPDLGRSFCFSAGGHVRMACCRVNQCGEAYSRLILGDSLKPTRP